MPAKKTKKQRTEAKKAAANLEKTTAAGIADAKVTAGAVKTAPGKGDARKGGRK